MGKPPVFSVNAARGKDEDPGSKERPWRTINHALKQLQAGDTLYLRAGTYFENVYCAVAGTPAKPITIRAYHMYLMHGRGKPLGVESLYFYQNTFVSNAAPDAFAHRTLSKANNVTKRRVFNNAFVYLNRYGRLRPFNQESPPGIHCDGNVHWCAEPKVTAPKDFLERVRKHHVSEANKESYPPGLGEQIDRRGPSFPDLRGLSRRCR